MLDLVSDGSNPLPKLALDPSPEPKTRTGVRLELASRLLRGEQAADLADTEQEGTDHWQGDEEEQNKERRRYEREAG